MVVMPGVLFKIAAEHVRIRTFGRIVSVMHKAGQRRVACLFDRWVYRREIRLGDLDEIPELVRALAGRKPEEPGFGFPAFPDSDHEASIGADHVGHQAVIVGITIIVTVRFRIA